MFPYLKIFFVDDASPDGTAEAIKRLATEDKNILLMERPLKSGLGSAYRDVFNSILSGDLPDYIVTMDADLSHSPEELSFLIDALKENDLVIGSRYVSGGKTENWSGWRRFLSRWGNRYAAFWTGLKPRDLTSGFNAYKTSLLKTIDLNSINTDGYAFQIEIKQKLIAAGARYREVPIVFRERVEGCSKLSKNIVLEGIYYPLKNFYLRKKNLLWGVAIFLSTFILYCLTAPHTIFTNDNAEFVTAAAVGGVAHPSGYPLFVMLSWLFAKIPIGELPYRVNLLSAFFASSSLVLIYFFLSGLLRRFIDEKSVPPYIVALLVAPLGVLQMFWFQAIVAKTYTLNLFLIFSSILFLEKFLEKKRNRYLYGFALVDGLGLSNHPIFILILPFLGVLLLRKGIWNAKKIAICFGLFMAGLLPYLYLPIRAAMHPLLNWGNVTSWPAFWRFVSRAQYNDIGISDFASKLQYFSSFCLNAWNQFGWVLPLGVIGVIWIFKNNKRASYILSALIIGNVLGIILLRTGGYNYANGEFFAPYYLPAYASIHLFVMVGILFLAGFLKKFAYFSGALACGAIIIFLLATNWRSNNLVGFKFIDELSRQTLISLPPKAVFIVNVGNVAGDTTSFSFMYQQYVNMLRPDVTIVGLPNIFPQIDNQAVVMAMSTVDAPKRRESLYQYAISHYPGRFVYATFPYANGDAPCANGYVYSLNACGKLVQSIFEISKSDKSILKNDVFGQQYLANYYYARAARKLQEGDKIGELNELTEAIASDPMPGSQQLVDHQRLRMLRK